MKKDMRKKSMCKIWLFVLLPNKVHIQLRDLNLAMCEATPVDDNKQAPNGRRLKMSGCHGNKGRD